MSNKTFDTLRLIEAVFVPLATFLIAMTDTWDVPHVVAAGLSAAISAVWNILLERLK